MKLQGKLNQLVPSFDSALCIIIIGKKVFFCFRFVGRKGLRKIYCLLYTQRGSNLLV